ncbi:DUF397 domain-containing protein [Streptomyces sennicomposti]|uniref:DUF397 domain-containing protein n=1 Tax=Streptomyces sennicomposti TaxID=2873384 RepID=UPI001CA65536|nr:DUF397 domain-containing protein [Streptomyces sennicomposti]MBY8865517.1 DUF397 domain-containing protein [Streptomyces sennicomposti]
MTAKPSAERSSELAWFKSSYSTNDGPSCVEVAYAPKTIHVRDSKSMQGPQLAFHPHQWTTFIENVGGLI